MRLESVAGKSPIATLCSPSPRIGLRSGAGQPNESSSPSTIHCRALSRPTRLKGHCRNLNRALRVGWPRVGDRRDNNSRFIAFALLCYHFHCQLVDCQLVDRQLVDRQLVDHEDLAVAAFEGLVVLHAHDDQARPAMGRDCNRLCLRDPLIAARCERARSASARFSVRSKGVILSSELRFRFHLQVWRLQPSRGSGAHVLGEVGGSTSVDRQSTTRRGAFAVLTLVRRRWTGRLAQAAPSAAAHEFLYLRF
jgi:hypothetical protein